MPITLEYPSDLPLPTNAVSSDQQTGTVQTSADLGVPGVYKWSDDGVVVFDLVWNFNQDQETQFLDFFYDDLDNGSRWFLMDVQWLVDKGGQTRQLECNFQTLKPEYSNIGKRRVMTSRVTVRTPYRDTLEFYEAYLPLLGLEDDISDLLNALAVFANETLPTDLPG